LEEDDDEEEESEEEIDDDDSSGSEVIDDEDDDSSDSDSDSGSSDNDNYGNADDDNEDDAGGNSDADADADNDEDKGGGEGEGEQYMPGDSEDEDESDRSASASQIDDEDEHEDAIDGDEDEDEDDYDNYADVFEGDEDEDENENENEVDDKDAAVTVLPNKKSTKKRKRKYSSASSRDQDHTKTTTTTTTCTSTARRSSSKKKKSRGASGIVNDEVWNRYFHQLVLYKKTHQTLTIPLDPCTKKSPPLRAWSNHQRAKKRANTLSPRCINLLLSIGFQFDPDHHRWMMMYKEVIAYAKNHNGSTEVPFRFQGENDIGDLGGWVAHQRNTYSNKRLTSERIDLLNKINFTWQPNKADRYWRKMYQKLLHYKQEHHNSTDVPANYLHDRSLGVWVTKQRYNYQKNGYPPAFQTHYIGLLQKIDFDFHLSSFDDIECVTTANCEYFRAKKKPSSKQPNDSSSSHNTK